VNDLIKKPTMEVPITEERPWAVFSACRDVDPGLFFPLTHAEEEAALRVCSGCAVRIDCFEYALESRVHFGVWGGMTEKQRKSLLRRSA